MKKFLALAVVGALFAATSASAAITGVTPGGTIIAAPGSALDGVNESSTMQGFDEMPGFVVGAGGLAVDGGVIAPGTLVNSHMIFLDPVDGNLTYLEDIVWTFSETVVGVMSDYTGSLEVASTGDLGALGTTYPAAAFDGRGMEPGDQDDYSISGSTLTVSMQATSPGDWIRVITSETVIPEPSTIAVWSLLGLIGCAVAYRRRK
jgi:hypothetical protein